MKAKKSKTQKTTKTLKKVAVSAKPKTKKIVAKAAVKTNSKADPKKKVAAVPVIARNPSGSGKKKNPEELAREILGIYAEPSKNKAPIKRPGMDFIGSFPIRNGDGDKKIELKKAITGPVFDPRTVRVGYFSTPLGQAEIADFKATYSVKLGGDKIEARTYSYGDLATAMNDLQNKNLDIFIADMEYIPVQLSQGLHLGSILKREDPRETLVTKMPYGALAELPRQAKIGCSSPRHVMQVKNQRPDIEIHMLVGNIEDTLASVYDGALDGALVPWAILRRMNVTPRFYAALQVEHVLPSPCQGIVGAVVLEEDTDLLGRLKLAEDSEASWASRCERAFLKKLNGNYRAPVGAFAHRKGTQDPWILDAVIGDQRTGETLRYREIGTSRCKPESLADKAYAGILSRGAKKFLPFNEAAL